MKRLDDLEAKCYRDAGWTGKKYIPGFRGQFNVRGSNETIDKSEIKNLVLQNLIKN